MNNETILVALISASAGIIGALVGGGVTWYSQRSERKEKHLIDGLTEYLRILEVIDNYHWRSKDRQLIPDELIGNQMLGNLKTAAITIGDQPLSHLTRHLVRSFRRWHNAMLNRTVGEVIELSDELYGLINAATDRCSTCLSQSSIIRSSTDKRNVTIVADLNKKHGNRSHREDLWNEYSQAASGTKAIEDKVDLNQSWYLPLDQHPASDTQA